MAREQEEYDMEQEMEIEALEAILMDDFKEIGEEENIDLSTDLKCYRVKVEAIENPEPNSYPPILGLIFAHTKNYPDEAPFIYLESLSGLTVSQVDRINEVLLSKIEECIGMAMIFELVTIAKEFMQDELVTPGGGNDNAEEIALRVKLEEEERIAKARAAGTPVTPETFAEWKIAFDKEMDALRGTKAIQVTDRVTGKKYFESRDGQVEADIPSDDDEDFVDEDEDEEEQGEAETAFISSEGAD